MPCRGADRLPAVRPAQVDTLGGPRSGSARRYRGRSGERRAPVCPRRCSGADLPAAARGSHRAVARSRPTGRLPGDDRRRAARLLYTADWSSNGHAPCWPTGRPMRPVPCSELGSRYPTFGRERRWGTCGAQRSATGRCPTTPTSGCVPTSATERRDQSSRPVRLRRLSHAFRLAPTSHRHIGPRLATSVLSRLWATGHAGAEARD